MSHPMEKNKKINYAPIFHITKDITSNIFSYYEIKQELMLASVSHHSKNQPPWPCLKQAELTVSPIPMLMSFSSMLQVKGKLALEGLLEPS